MIVTDHALVRAAQTAKGVELDLRIDDEMPGRVARCVGRRDNLVDGQPIAAVTDHKTTGLVRKSRLGGGAQGRHLGVRDGDFGWAGHGRHRRCPPASPQEAG